MPKAKQKVPKTEKMWMGWNPKEGFLPDTFGSYGEVKRLAWKDEDIPIPVRIVPEAEYQRFKEMEKDYERLMSL